MFCLRSRYSSGKEKLCLAFHTQLPERSSGGAEEGAPPAVPHSSHPKRAGLLCSVGLLLG